jgi:hypothetical protein
VGRIVSVQLIAVVVDGGSLHRIVDRQGPGCRPNPADVPCPGATR